MASVRTHIQLDKAIHDKLEMLFWDPVRGQLRYGKRTRLINHLLREWLAKLPKQPGAVEDLVEAIGEDEDGSI